MPTDGSTTAAGAAGGVEISTITAGGVTTSATIAVSVVVACGVLGGVGVMGSTGPLSGVTKVSAGGTDDCIEKLAQNHSLPNGSQSTRCTLQWVANKFLASLKVFPLTTQDS